MESVALETEDPLDDIRVNFESGWTALIQAKRTLAKGKNFSKAVDQWVKAAQSSLDPETHRFVIVGGSLSGPIRDLQQMLQRYQSDLAGPPTKGEADALVYLEGLLGALTPNQQGVVLKCGVICELSVEEIYHSDAKLGTLYLGEVVSGDNLQDGVNAWKALVSAAGRAARLRGGYSLEGWLAELRGVGVSIDPAGRTPAAEFERRHTAVERYKSRLVRTGLAIDLRHLGAQISPIPLEESDADVKVGTDPEDPRAESDLLWAFLRRGRIVLTGLPGGGKTTAIRILAARLCRLPGAPLPLRVSLKDVNALGTTESFRDRLLTVAVRDDAPEDRALIRGELERRLAAGGVALLLDSLDETYDRRAAVASEIDEFMASVSTDVDSLLSTRDVAYGHAATLGWDDLSLRPPKETERAVGAILRRAVETKVPGADADRWVSDRMDWVREALSRDSKLRETPLLPILLALLAAEKEIDTLPAGRARVLADVVRDAVSRHEIARNPSVPLGPLVGSAIDTAAMHAFAVEASAILDANGSIKLDQLTPVVAREMATHWAMGPGYAETTARDAIRFFDGNGIFVVTGSTETVAPRLALFAEIGDALRATLEPDALIDWVNARIRSRQFEPLILAAGLDQAAAEALGGIAGDSDDRDVLHSAVRAHTEGASMTSGDIRAICARLITDLGAGIPSSWASWAQLLCLPITADMRDDIEAAVMSYDRQRQKLVRAELDLRFRSREDLQGAPESLLDLLSLEHLPHIDVPNKDRSFSLAEYFQNDQLDSAQIAAAKILVGVVPEAAALVVGRAQHGPPNLKEELREILSQAGFQAEADATAEPMPDWKELAWFRDYEADTDRKLLGLLAARQGAELTYQQQTRVDELADLLATLRMNDASSIYMFKHPDDVPRVIELTEALFGMDSAVISQQATLTIERMDAVGNSDPYYSLFDKATVHHNRDWDSIDDIEAAVALLGRMMAWGNAHARYVATALWRAPVAEPASNMIRLRLPHLASSPRHLRIAARTLCSLVEGPEPQSWVASEDPVLRAVAADLSGGSENGYLTEQLSALLNDPDGCVRLAALNRAAELHPQDIQGLLTTIRDQPTSGWMCTTCRTFNPPGAGSCTKPRCYNAAPNVPKRAQELLDQMLEKASGS